MPFLITTTNSGPSGTISSTAIEVNQAETAAADASSSPPPNKKRQKEKRLASQPTKQNGISFMEESAFGILKGKTSKSQCISKTPKAPRTLAMERRKSRGAVPPNQNALP